MREWINSVLQFISATSLTDDEFNSLDTSGFSINQYNQSSYDTISALLISRESISPLHDRLIAVYKARGVDVSPAKVGRSNIFIGAPL